MKSSIKQNCIDMNCYKLYITFLGIVIGIEILISIRLAFACTQLYVLFFYVLTCSISNTLPDSIVEAQIEKGVPSNPESEKEEATCSQYPILDDDQNSFHYFGNTWFEWNYSHNV